ncbi:trypsin-like serine protease [Fodinicola feengrottensis]|uniref:trypsin-like serine protease n=1 Tax=Fodinicola feengrottensis TaxID=435914 RepID=UPI0024413B9B|nr:trypsin-like serine protease [Fodinicola feengrottensis]
MDQRKGRLVHPIPHSRVDNPHADITMIKVQPMNVPVAKLATTSVHIGQIVRQYGWGATCTSDENACQSNVLRQSVLLRVVSPHDPRCVGLVGPGGTDFCAQKVWGIPAGGDSGGPVMTGAAAGTQVLVGVLDGSDRDSTANAGQIFAQLQWIHAVLRK